MTFFARRRLDEDGGPSGPEGPEAKRARIGLMEPPRSIRVPILTDPSHLWAMAPSPGTLKRLTRDFSIRTLRMAQDVLSLYGWMLDGAASLGRLDRWTLTFILAQEIYSKHGLPFDENPREIGDFRNTGTLILFDQEDDLCRLENGLYRKILKASGPSLDVNKLRLLAKASSVVRFYRLCLNALVYKEAEFTAEINPARVRAAMERGLPSLSIKDNDELRKDLWSHHLGLGELCVYCQTTGSSFSRTIDVSAIVKRTEERATCSIHSDLKSADPDSPERAIADLWAFDAWIRVNCLKNPAFVASHVITWRLHCREESTSLLLADIVAMAWKRPVVLMLGHRAWAVIDNKIGTWFAFDNVSSAIACLMLQVRNHHAAVFANFMPIPALPESTRRA